MRRSSSGGSACRREVPTSRPAAQRATRNTRGEPVPPAEPKEERIAHMPKIAPSTFFNFFLPGISMGASH